jgi:hypothetical protein
MNEEHKQELRQEYLEELRKESFYEWLEANRSELEGEFIQSFPPEEQPLDDDTPDFISNNCAEFEEWAEHIYFLEVE